MKRIALAAAALSIAAVGAFAAPASAAGACATLDITINGEASPANGTYCTPELPPVE